MKTLKKLIAMTCSLSILLQVSAHDSIRHVSLRQACQLVSDSNLNVVNARLDVQKSNYQLHESQSKLYPHIEGYSDFSY